MSKRKHRVTQHKETTDKSELKKARELRAENQKLKRQLSRLRREMSKGTPPEPDFEEPPTAIEAPKEVNTPNRCCSEPDLSAIALGGRTLIVCKNCGYRKMEIRK